MTEVARALLAHKWAHELAEHTGRSVGVVEADGLSAFDFKPRGIRIAYDDGSVVTFRWAFFVRSATEPNLIAVFTEHCGYHEFSLGPEDKVEYCELSSQPSASTKS